MIDIHCHILPGLDDGAQTIYEAIDIAQKLIEAGYDTVIATPHVIEGKNYNTPRQIREKVMELNRVLEKREIPLEVLPGAENLIFPDLAKWYQEGRILSLADSQKYILVELPMASIPLYAQQVFFELQLLGLIPILAHPERNREIIRHPERLIHLVNSGVQIQINIGSLQGKYGASAKILAGELLTNGFVHYLGSDMHDIKNNRLFSKTSLVIEGMRTNKLIAATVDNPAQILRGDSIKSFREDNIRSESRRRNMGRAFG